MRGATMPSVHSTMRYLAWTGIIRTVRICDQDHRPHDHFRSPFA